MFRSNKTTRFYIELNHIHIFLNDQPPSLTMRENFTLIKINIYVNEPS